MTTTQLLTTAEAAEWARVSAETIRRWYRTGQLKADKKGKKGPLRFTLESLMECCPQRVAQQSGDSEDNTT